jgi:hypothetical protein
MTARRSASLIVPQRAISANVRPHPSHNPDTGSTTQTREQGDETGAMSLI